MIRQMEKKRHHRSGVITIEATIVMPLVIVTILGFMYFMKIIYIQNAVHSAMTRAGHELVAYTLPLKELGVVDAQHEAMYTGHETSVNLTQSVKGVVDNGQSLLERTKGMTDFFIDNETMTIDVPELDNPSNVLLMIDQGFEMIEQMPGVIDRYNEDLMSLIEQVNDLIGQAKNGISDVVLAEVIDYANNMVSREITKFGVNEHLEVEQLEAWGVSNPYDEGYPIDFGDSSLMLYDDTIELVARYTINAPFLSGLVDGIPIYQSVSIRAFTGSYDYSGVEIKPPIVKQKVEEETDVYISLKVKDPPYHIYACLRNEVSVGSIYMMVTINGKNVCKYCSEHYIPVDDGCYYTKSGSVVHYSKTCPQIYASDIRALTLEEYESGEYRPCKNCDPDTH